MNEKDLKNSENKFNLGKQNPSEYLLQSINPYEKKHPITTQT